MSPLIFRNFLVRRSIFSFSSTPVEIEKLNLIFEAARWAPSSVNSQPWRFIYAGKEDDSYKDMFSLLDNGNKIWAQSAPILILTLAEVYDHNKKRSNTYALHDLGLSTANLLLQASILGLYTHPMGGFDHDLAKKLFNISDGFEPGTMIALGYAGDPSVLPEDLLKRQLAVRLRKKISEIAFRGGLNTPVSESGS